LQESNAQTFVGQTTAEALEQVKESLGEDAVLLGQRVCAEVVVSPEPGEGGSPMAYRGETMEEALRCAQEDLGPGVLVLAEREIVEVSASASENTGTPEPFGGRPAGSTPEAAERRMPLPGATGLLRRTYAPDPQPEPAVPGPSVKSEQGEGRGVSGGGACLWPRVSSGPAAAEGHDEMLAEICSRLEELRRLAKQTDRPAVPEPLCDMYMRLLENEVTEDLARHLVERLSEGLGNVASMDRGAIREAMLDAIARLIPTEGGIRPRREGRPTVVVLVGPTGVGKTTSIAKLATYFHVRQGKKVALISEDTTRPGGADPLRSVAQLLSVPLTVADTTSRIQTVIRQARDRDLVLIDTAGRAPRNEAAMEELASFLNEIGPDEVHLTLCSHSGHRYVLDVIDRFGRVDFNRVLFTKLDEAATYGMLLNVATHVDRGLSYVTTGQNYMDKIAAGDPRKLAELVLVDPESKR
jgi:flagellar biosynthesis protein FlhF